MRDLKADSLLLIFAVAFMGCVLATPVVTRIALWAGAIDRPDHFRRIHKRATPRLGGLGLAFGLAIGVVLVSVAGYLDHWSGFAAWWPRQWPVLSAALIVLMVGFVDDTRTIGPRASCSARCSPSSSSTSAGCASRDSRCSASRSSWGIRA